MKATPLEHYLERYAEPEIRLIDSLFLGSDKQYQASLIIPAFDEHPDFLVRLQNHPNIKNILVILVINQKSGTEPSSLNREILKWIEENFQKTSTKDNILFFLSECFDLIVIDRFSHQNQIPEKQGVGLARKIASDVACACHQSKLITSEWIFSTDADATLPENYFSILKKTNPDFSALVFNFHHIEKDTSISLATQLYEKSIKYYRSALEWAGSPYAFFTLGSTLGFNIHAYTKVRGFPKRSGGEDFYLLNKIAKIGPVKFLENVTVDIEPRISERVPFGTGPAVKKIIEKIEKHEDYCYYDVKIFEHLQEWILWTTNVLPEIFLSDKNDNSNWYLQARERLSPENIAFIDFIQFSDFVSHCVNQCSDEKAFISQFHIWFDAFKTLKYVHFLQEKYFPDTALEQCLDVQNNWS